LFSYVFLLILLAYDLWSRARFIAQRSGGRFPDLRATGKNTHRQTAAWHAFASWAQSWPVNAVYPPVLRRDAVDSLRMDRGSDKLLLRCESCLLWKVCCRPAGRVTRISVTNHRGMIRALVLAVSLRNTVADVGITPSRGHGEHDPKHEVGRMPVPPTSMAVATRPGRSWDLGQNSRQAGAHSAIFLSVLERISFLLPPVCGKRPGAGVSGCLAPQL